MRTPRHILAIGVFVLLTAAMVWRLIPVITHALPSDLGDPVLNTWILWWNAHAVPLTARWWDAPIFFPSPSAFALSESLLGLTPLTSPVIWLTGNPVLAYNLAFILAWPTAAFGAYLLAFRLTGRRDAAIIAGIAYGFAPYRIGQAPHLQVLWSCWMPLALAALHRYVDTQERRALVAFGVCWLLNGLSNGYFLLYFPVLLACWMLWFVRRSKDPIAIGVTAAVASLPLLPLLLQYRARQAALGLHRPLDEIRSFSADLSSVFATAWRALARAWTILPRPEGELYPGVVLVLLIAAGLVYACRREAARVRLTRPQRVVLVLVAVIGLVALASLFGGGWQVKFGGTTLRAKGLSRLFVITLLCGGVSWWLIGRAAWQRRSPLVFYTLAAGVMLAFALGPVPLVWGAKIADLSPYQLFMALPGGDSLRVPARFGMLWALCLSQAGALALAQVSATRRQWMVPLGVLIALDGWAPDLPAWPVPEPLGVPALPQRTAVFELPLRECCVADLNAMFHGMSHGHPVVNGMSGYLAPHYGPMTSALQNGDTSGIDALRQYGDIAVYVNHAEDPANAWRDMIAAVPGGRRLDVTDKGVWYLFPSVTPTDPTIPLPELPIASIVATRNPGDVSAMRDHDLFTRWNTPNAQAPGDRVTIDLGAAVMLQRLDVSLGPFTGDYPRELDVTLSSESGEPVKVWSGSPLRLIQANAMRRPRDASMTIDMAPTRARYVTLTVTKGDPVFFWSIAELRAYGER